MQYIPRFLRVLHRSGPVDPGPDTLTRLPPRNNPVGPELPDVPHRLAALTDAERAVRKSLLIAVGEFSPRAMDWGGTA
ncbi:hypothetical protein ACFWP3_09605 [Streptomyces sp. NPDC058525]|uniref:hypothetical protein n=1 Tax=Streptomyces sp. NPDC058525 TaxID=3346538 RepID=UPI003663008C